MYRYDAHGIGIIRRTDLGIRGVPICDEILQGQYTEEERILSVREYAATVEVNANTVVRTYDYLQGQEIIYNKRGIGYFK